MKAILISIKPKWCAKILNGEKTIEVRKTMPKCDLPITVYIYCTKDEKYPLVLDINGCVVLADKHYCYGDIDLNGKVVAKFILNKVEEIICDNDDYGLEIRTNSMMMYKLLDKSCLSEEEIARYLPIPEWSFAADGYTKVGYAWYIDNLEIFDKPKELSEFKPFNNGMPQYKFIKNGCEDIKLTKAPQSWRYIEI